MCLCVCGGNQKTNTTAVGSVGPSSMKEERSEGSSIEEDKNREESKMKLRFGPYADCACEEVLAKTHDTRNSSCGGRETGGNSKT